jgi:hypothetical protein
VNIDPEFVQQINGDLRIDDRGEGPLLKIEFFAEFASMFSDEEKAQICGSAADKISEIMLKKFPEPDEVPRRREAILAQRARNSE